MRFGLHEHVQGKQTTDEPLFRPTCTRVYTRLFFSLLEYTRLIRNVSCLVYIDIFGLVYIIGKMRLLLNNIRL